MKAKAKRAILKSLGNRLRKDNLIRIIETLWHKPQVSRAHIARQLRLDRSTVGQLVDFLIEHGVIEEDSVCRAQPKIGRPPRFLKIRAGYCYVIGIELTFPLIRLTAIDLNRQILGEKDLKIQSHPTIPLEELGSEIKKLREQVDKTYNTRMGLVALGLGVSGLVNTADGTIELSDAFSIKRSTPLGSLLEAKIGKPCYLFNDAQACALGETGLRNINNLLFVRIELRPGTKPENIGVGVGCFLEGNLLHGRSVTHLLRPAETDKPWKEGGKMQFIDRLAHSIAVVVNILGIEQIIFGGDLTGIYPDIGEIISSYVHRKDQITCFKPLNIEESLSGPRAVSYGACCAALDRLFLLRQFPFEAEEG